MIIELLHRSNYSDYNILRLNKRHDAWHERDRRPGPARAQEAADARATSPRPRGACSPSAGSSASPSPRSRAPPTSPRRRSSTTSRRRRTSSTGGLEAFEERAARRDPRPRARASPCSAAFRALRARAARAARAARTPTPRRAAAALTRMITESPALLARERAGPRPLHRLARRADRRGDRRRPGRRRALAWSPTR